MMRDVGIQSVMLLDMMNDVMIGIINWRPRSLDQSALASRIAFRASAGFDRTFLRAGLGAGTLLTPKPNAARCPTTAGRWPPKPYKLHRSTGSLPPRCLLLENGGEQRPGVFRHKDDALPAPASQDRNPLKAPRHTAHPGGKPEPLFISSATLV